MSYLWGSGLPLPSMAHAELQPWALRHVCRSAFLCRPRLYFISQRSRAGRIMSQRHVGDHRRRDQNGELMVSSVCRGGGTPSCRNDMVLPQTAGSHGWRTDACYHYWYFWLVGEFLVCTKTTMLTVRRRNQPLLHNKCKSARPRVLVEP